jgi:hypothetical protein
MIVDLRMIRANATNGFVPAAIPARAFDGRRRRQVGASQVVTFPVVSHGGVPAGTPSMREPHRPAGPSRLRISVASSAPVLTSNINRTGQTGQRGVRAGRAVAGERVRVDGGARHRRRVRVVQHGGDAELFKPLKNRSGRPSAHDHPPVVGSLKVTDIVGVPSTTAVVLNVTVTACNAGSSQSAANMPADVGITSSPAKRCRTVARASRRQCIKIWTFADAHIIVDVAGWFS